MSRDGSGTPGTPRGFPFVSTTATNGLSLTRRCDKAPEGGLVHGYGYHTAGPH